MSTHDALADIAGRQAEFEERERQAIAAMRATAANFRVLTAKVTRLLFDAVTSPAGEARFRSFYEEHPERADAFVERMAKVLDLTSRTDERASMMRRLLDGESTSIQEHRVAPAPPEPPSDPERAEARRRLMNRLKAVGASAKDPSNGYQGEASKVIDVEAHPVRLLPDPIGEEHES